VTAAAIPDPVRGLCDALEWLLVPWGHRHTGVVAVGALDPTRTCAWTNTPPFDATPEAVLYADGTTGGSPAWVLGAAGPMAAKLCAAIAARGWRVQRVDCRGVEVVPAPGGDRG
jgi:hypothetical protein